MAEPAENAMRIKRLRSFLIGVANNVSDIHNEAFYLQVVIGSNIERLTDTQSGVLALSDERKHIILGEADIREEVTSEAQ